MWSLALSGSTLTLGGEFTRMLSVSSPPATGNRVAAIDTGTHTVTPWNPTIGDGSVYAVARLCTSAAHSRK